MNTPLTKLQHVRTVVEGGIKATVYAKPTSYGETRVVTLERCDKFGVTEWHDPQLFYLKDIQSLHTALGRLLAERYGFCRP